MSFDDFEKCCKCGHNAFWSLSNEFFCDDCVPRDRSNNYELKPGIKEIFDDTGVVIINPAEDWYYPVDQQGRFFPCCEAAFNESGWHKGD